MTIYEKIKKYETYFSCIYKMNKMHLYCIRCAKVTDSSTNIKLKYKTDGIYFIICRFYGLDGIYRLYSKCVARGFKEIAAIDEEELNDSLKKALKKEKLHYPLFRDFDEKLNKKN